MKAPYRRLAIALGVLIGLTLVSSTVMGGMLGNGAMMGTGTMMMPGMMGNAGTAMMPHMGGWTMSIAMGLMWLTMFAFWGALIVGIIYDQRHAPAPAPGGRRATAGHASEAAAEAAPEAKAAGEG